MTGLNERIYPAQRWFNHMLVRLHITYHVCVHVRPHTYNSAQRWKKICVSGCTIHTHMYKPRHTHTYTSAACLSEDRHFLFPPWSSVYTIQYIYTCIHTYKSLQEWLITSSVEEGTFISRHDRQYIQCNTYIVYSTHIYIHTHIKICTRMINHIFSEESTLVSCHDRQYIQRYAHIWYSMYIYTHIHIYEDD